ncbi:hypothetical protein C5167_026257 [Papaver somniferum]|nr:hypothetical protein C5167_026257 [Papaver somniferum]
MMSMMMIVRTEKLDVVVKHLNRNGIQARFSVELILHMGIPSGSSKVEVLWSSELRMRQHSSVLLRLSRWSIRWNTTVDWTSRTSREFRNVRDNRVNQNSSREAKQGSVQCSTSSNTQVAPNASSEKRVGVDLRDAAMRVSNKDGAKQIATFNGPSGSGRHAQDAYLNGTRGKEEFTEIRVTVRCLGSRVQEKPYELFGVHRNPEMPSQLASGVAGIGFEILRQ